METSKHNSPEQPQQKPETRHQPETRPNSEVRRRWFRPPDKPMEDVAAKAIRDATERGEFDNLPGRGQPLRIAGDLADAATMGAKIRSNAGFSTPWGDLGREIDDGTRRAVAEIERAHKRRLVAQRASGVRASGADTAAGDSEWQRALAQFGTHLDELNRKILKFNLLIPPQLPHLHRVRLRVEVLLQPLGIESGS